MARIKLEDVSLTFRLRVNQAHTWKDLFLHRLWSGGLTQRKMIHALMDLNLEFKQGKRYGIIGHNGAGKSTLLHILAGIYTPTTGSVSIEGEVGSLFDLALGFETEATGWKNIAYRSYLQGRTPKWVKENRDRIAEFSELGDHINLPLRCYSAGMIVRLAFSIATSMEPEILLIDEALAAGDMHFQKKAQKRMHDLMDRANLVVLVSHDLDIVEETCDEVLWLDHGRPAKLGRSEEVVQAYRESQLTSTELKAA